MLGKKRLPIVKLHWVDAHVHSDGWLEPEEFVDWVSEPGVMISVGTLVEQNKDWVVLAQSVGDGCVADMIKVPTGMIKKLVKVGWLEVNEMETQGRSRRCRNQSTRQSSASTNSRSSRKSR